MVHEPRNEGNSFLLLITAVDHVQKWCQHLHVEKMCLSQQTNKCSAINSLTMDELTEPYLSQENKSLHAVNWGSGGGNHGASLSQLWQGDKERKNSDSTCVCYRAFNILCIFHMLTALFTIHVSVIRFDYFRAHLWLNFDLKATAEPTGLLQRRSCDPTYCLEDPLSHLLQGNVSINDIWRLHVNEKPGSRNRVRV